MAQSRVTVVKQLPDELFSELKETCAKRRLDEEWNLAHRLVGAMIQQSSLEVSQHLQDWIVDQTSNLWYDIKATCPWNPNYFFPDYLRLRDLWVNYQRPGEFNPVHCHNGVVSFVIFVDIPYGASERQYHRASGNFQLEDQILDVDAKWNGTLLMFPSYTQHAVYPYQSTDKERITVAGNIYWNVDEVEDQWW